MPRRPKKHAAGTALRPAGRTGTQVLGPGTIIALLYAFNVIRWNAAQTSAVMAVAVPAWAFVQNWWENRRGSALLISRADLSK